MDENVQKLYQMWSPHVGMSIEELEKEFQEIMSENAKEHPNDDEATKKFRALSRQQAFHSQQFKGGGKIFECIIIGAGTSYDPYKTERAEAIAKGFVNNEGKPLFWSKRFEWKWKGDNGEMKEVLIPDEQSNDSCSRRAYVVVKLESGNEWKKGIIFLNGKNICKNLPEFFVPTKVKLGIKDERLADPVLSLNSISATKFVQTSSQKINFKEMVGSLLTENFIDYDELSTIINSDDMPMGALITAGTVVNVNMTKDEIKSNIVELMRTSKTIDDLSKIGSEVETKTFWVPKDIKLNFGVGSEVLIVTQKSTRQDAEGKNVENFNALGIYPIYSTAPENSPQAIKMEEIKEDVEIITPSGDKK